MPYEYIIGIFVVVVALLILLLRTNGAVVFFSVCAGSVLSLQLSGEASLISSTLVKDGDLNMAIVSIGLLVLPAILSIFILRGSISSGKFIFNLFPSLATGALLVLLIIPLMPKNISGQILITDIWSKLLQFQPLILVFGVISSILLLFLTQNRSKGGRKKKESKSA